MLFHPLEVQQDTVLKASWPKIDTPKPIPPPIKKFYAVCAATLFADWIATCLLASWAANNAAFSAASFVNYLAIAFPPSMKACSAA